MMFMYFRCIRTLCSLYVLNAFKPEKDICTADQYETSSAHDNRTAVYKCDIRCDFTYFTSIVHTKNMKPPAILTDPQEISLHAIHPQALLQWPHVTPHLTMCSNGLSGRCSLCTIQGWTYYEKIGLIIMDYHGLSWIIMDYHGLSWMM